MEFKTKDFIIPKTSVIPSSSPRKATFHFVRRNALRWAKSIHDVDPEDLRFLGYSKADIGDIFIKHAQRLIRIYAHEEKGGLEYEDDIEKLRKYALRIKRLTGAKYYMPDRLYTTDDYPTGDLVFVNIRRVLTKGKGPKFKRLMCSKAKGDCVFLAVAAALGKSYRETMRILRDYQEISNKEIIKQTTNRGYGMNSNDLADFFYWQGAEVDYLEHFGSKRNPLDIYYNMPKNKFKDYMLLIGGYPGIGNHIMTIKKNSNGKDVIYDPSISHKKRPRQDAVKDFKTKMIIYK